MADKLVRQALNYAMDTEAIARFLFHGYAMPIASPFTASTLGYDTTIAPYPYDPDKAKKLLAEAGYPDGFEVTIDTTANRATWAQVIAGYLSEIGVRATLRPMESSIFNTNWVAGDVGDIVAASWGAAGDPQSYLQMLVRTGGTLNHYSNAAADELIDKSAVTLDPRRRATILRELQHVLHEDPAALYLWSAADIYAVSEAVQNWRPHSTERLIISDVTLD